MSSRDRRLLETIAKNTKPLDDVFRTRARLYSKVEDASPNVRNYSRMQVLRIVDDAILSAGNPWSYNVTDDRVWRIVQMGVYAVVNAGDGDLQCVIMPVNEGVVTPACSVYPLLWGSGLYIDSAAYTGFQLNAGLGLDYRRTDWGAANALWIDVPMVENYLYSGEKVQVQTDNMTVSVYITMTVEEYWNEV